jgi:hypothetical protein
VLADELMQTWSEVWACSSLCGKVVTMNILTVSKKIIIIIIILNLNLTPC